MNTTIALYHLDIDVQLIVMSPNIRSLRREELRDLFFVDTHLPVGIILHNDGGHRPLRPPSLSMYAELFGCVQEPHVN
jgi:hypothetical protein